tara:strand:+ start:528 stop:818 length:291 start_codon:yes stop_codon:yes gene_type:complete
MPPFVRCSSEWRTCDFDADQCEVVVLENIWRDEVWVARCVSLSLVFWRVLPLDVIRLIAYHAACNRRATEARRIKNTTRFEVALDCKFVIHPVTEV